MHNRPVAVVTGASRGIGRAIALELARLNHAVVVGYVSRADAAAEVVGQISAAGGRAIAVAADVADREARPRLVEAALAEFGRVDVLVNNAGITSPGRADLLVATEESFDQVIATNLRGPFFLAQQAAAAMIELRRGGHIERGTIINISSLSAYTVSPDRADYCLAKSALGMMTQLFAERLAEECIGVFEIRPGVIASDMTAPVKQKYDALIAAGLAPIRRWGTPEDVAKAVAAIVAGYFPYSTGQHIDVDGGFHIRRLR